jgi:hypothetical protein
VRDESLDAYGLPAAAVAEAAALEREFAPPDAGPASLDDEAGSEDE